MRLRWNVKNPALRTALPVLGRIVAIGVALSLAGALVVWGIDLGRRISKVGGAAAGPDPRQQLALLQAELTRVELERDQLQGAAKDQAAQLDAARQRAGRIAALELENGKLIEDLASVQAGLSDTKGVAISWADASLDGPTRARVRLVLTQGGKKTPPEARGTVRLAVTALQQGKEVLLMFPPEGALDQAAYALNLGRLQRFELALVLPEAVSLKSIQASVLENGKVRTTRPVVLKDDTYTGPE